MPLILDCPNCGGSAKGCDHCEYGRIRITRCPLLEVTDDVWDVMDMADFYEKGLPPVSGGTLDQSYSFIQACKFIWSEIRWWKAKRGIE